MDLIRPEIDAWLEAQANLDDPILQEMEALAVNRDFPAIGPQVGSVLHWLTKLIGAKRIAELGSGFGYSAHWFARALGNEGIVQLTEGDPDRVEESKTFLERAGLIDRCKFYCGNALDWLAADETTWDIIFCDVDKEQYSAVPDLAYPRLKSGGLLIFDNVLWSGRFLDADDSSSPTEGVRALHHSLRQDDRFSGIYLPVRDGIWIGTKQ